MNLPTYSSILIVGFGFYIISFCYIVGQIFPSYGTSSSTGHVSRAGGVLSRKDATIHYSNDPLENNILPLVLPRKDATNHETNNNDPTTTASADAIFVGDYSTWANNNLLPVHILPLSAFVEPAIPYWIPFTNTTNKPFGEPIIPLPLRTQSPSSLKILPYPKVRSCADVPMHLPVGPGLEKNARGKVIFQNVFNTHVVEDPLETAPFCPVDADPFLPWIHDVFPSSDGHTVHFIAQNKRRCNQGKAFHVEIERLVPQVTLMQGVSVTKVAANDIPKELWRGGNGKEEDNTEEQRWRLSTIEDADPAGELTRFICRFKGVSPSGKVVALGETLSVFPINYELIHARKRNKYMLSKKGKDKGYFWLSSFQFDCPVPDIEGLREAIRSGTNVIENKAIVYVDIVPIRTPPRVLDGLHMKGESANPFDAASRWGNDHILPKIEASGRWANIPICHHHGLTPSDPDKEETRVGKNPKEDVAISHASQKKKHELVGCIWTSAVYKTRGNQMHLDDTEERLLEWIEFHLLVGFDHLYIYDNTAGVMDDGRNLASVTNKFRASEVTRIDWPFRVCNNNTPAHKNTGERSSQYAAEASCLKRYGPTTEWIANFDPDEYFVPMGTYNNLKDMLTKAKSAGTNILSFRSARAYLNAETLVPHQSKRCGELDSRSASTPNCLDKDPAKTFLQTYNCDVTPPPKAATFDRARKQIYRPEYVASHFVHYSTVTKPMLTYHPGEKWAFAEQAPSERVVDESNEALMIHAKTMGGDATLKWSSRCHRDYQRGTERGDVRCKVGTPFPPGTKYYEGMPPLYTEEGIIYNCWPVEKITNFWVPKLDDAIKRRKDATAK